MSKRITEASRFTVCYTCNGGTEQRYECTADNRADALSKLAKTLPNGTSFSVLRVVPCWLSKTKK